MANSSPAAAASASTARRNLEVVFDDSSLRLDEVIPDASDRETITGVSRVLRSLQLHRSVLPVSTEVSLSPSGGAYRVSVEFPAQETQLSASEIYGQVVMSWPLLVKDVYIDLARNVVWCDVIKHERLSARAGSAEFTASAATMAAAREGTDNIVLQTYRLSGNKKTCA